VFAAPIIVVLAYIAWPRSSRRRRCPDDLDPQCPRSGEFWFISRRLHWNRWPD
jgi:hypothetical protein